MLELWCCGVCAALGHTCASLLAVTAWFPLLDPPSPNLRGSVILRHCWVPQGRGLLCRGRGASRAVSPVPEPLSGCHTQGHPISCPLGTSSASCQLPEAGTGLLTVLVASPAQGELCLLWSSSWAGIPLVPLPGGCLCSQLQKPFWTASVSCKGPAALQGQTPQPGPDSLG